MKIAKDYLNIAKKIKEIINEELLPPQEITLSERYDVLPHSLFENTKGYLEKINHQINKCYKEACYDACAVMIRRLVEALIIEVFESHRISHKIKNGKGEFLYLDELINKTLAETSWNLSRNTKTALQRKHFKKIGDQSAHSRHYNARRGYIDDIINDLRAVSEDLLYLANLKK